MSGSDQQIEPETEMGGGIAGQGGQQAPAVVALEDHLTAHGESRPAGQ